MMDYHSFIPITYFLINSFLVSYLFDLSPFRSLFISIFVNLLILYVFSLLNYLQLGLYALVLIVFLLVTLSLNKFRKKPNITINHEWIVFTLVSLTLSYFIVWLNQERYLFQYDDFAHWGLMIKETLRLDKLYSSPLSKLVSHRDYPPIIILFEYQWITLARSFKEPYIFQSLQFLELALIIPLFERKKYNKNVILIPVFIIAWIGFNALFSFEDGHFYTTLYLDAILGLLFARSIFLILTTEYKKIDILELALTLSVLILSKEMGLIFVGFSILIFIFSIMRVPLKKRLLTFLYTFSAPILFYLTWKVYLSIHSITGQFQTQKLDLSSLIELLFNHQGEAYQLQTLSRYMSSLQSVNLVNESVNLSFISLSILLFILIILIRPTRVLKKDLSISILLTIIGFGYAFILLTLYIFMFSKEEALILASYQRYLSTYSYAIGALIFFLWTKKSMDKPLSKSFTVLVAITVLIYISLPIEHKDWLKKDTLYDEDSYFYSNDINAILSNTPDESHIYFIAQDHNPNWLDKFRYWINTRTFNVDGHSLGLPYNEYDIVTQNISTQEFENRLKDFDYIYIYWMDDSFIKNYGILFPSYFKNENHQLYKIEWNDHKLTLIKIV